MENKNVTLNRKKTKLEKMAIFLSLLVFVFPFLQFFHIIPVKMDSMLGELMWGGLSAIACISCFFVLIRTRNEFYLLPIMVLFCITIIKFLQGFGLWN
jgi:hypothetical protein